MFFFREIRNIFVCFVNFPTASLVSLHFLPEQSQRAATQSSAEWLLGALVQPLRLIHVNILQINHRTLPELFSLSCFTSFALWKASTRMSQVKGFNNAVFEGMNPGFGCLNNLTLIFTINHAGGNHGEILLSHFLFLMHMKVNNHMHQNS